MPQTSTATHGGVHVYVYLRMALFTLVPMRGVTARMTFIVVNTRKTCFWFCVKVGGSE